MRKQRGHNVSFVLHTDTGQTIAQYQSVREQRCIAASVTSTGTKQTEVVVSVKIT